MGLPHEKTHVIKKKKLLKSQQENNVRGLKMSNMSEQTFCQRGHGKIRGSNRHMLRPNMPLGSYKLKHKLNSTAYILD